METQRERRDYVLAHLENKIQEQSEAIGPVATRELNRKAATDAYYLGALHEVLDANNLEHALTIRQLKKFLSDISAEEDEEDNNVRVAFAVVVGANNRPDQYHRRACCADDAGEARAEQEQGAIGQRGAVEVTADDDAAGGGEQGEQKQDEGDVFEESGVQQRACRGLEADRGEERQGQQQRPEGGDLALVMLPKMIEKQGKKRNREQDADKRHGP